MVSLSNVFDSATARWTYEVVASDAYKAIDKAKTQARREGWRRTGYIVEQITHRGAAV
jgi:hypothetical protein